MNFKELVDFVRCYNCGDKVNNPKPLEHYPDKELICYNCECGFSYIIPYDKNEPLDSFSIHLPINEPHTTIKGTFHIPVITISADTGREIFEVKFHSKEPTLLDSSKYFKCNYIPEFIKLPKDELIAKLNELLVFI